MQIKVAKFGGTSVGNGDRIKKAATSVANEYKKGTQMVVVVSAVNKTTDDLINLTNDAIANNLTAKQHAEIVAMGERTSVRLFSATLESLGLFLVILIYLKNANQLLRNLLLYQSMFEYHYNLPILQM